MTSKSKRSPSVYLAASFRNAKPLMRVYAASLRDLGVVVTSRWIDAPNQSDPLSDFAACRSAANECLLDIDAADMLVFFSEHVSIGKHVEFGYALAAGIRVVVIGSPTSVFHYLAGVTRYDTWEAFCDAEFRSLP